MKKLNPFQDLLVSWGIIILIIIVHGLFYKWLSYDSPIKIINPELQKDPLLTKYFLSSLAGLFINVILFLIGTIVYQIVIKPFIEAYRKSYPKLKNK